MKISDKGFITIPRALIVSSNWQEKRCFTVIEAYIDLQLMAYYGRTPTVHKINNCEVTLTKGQLCTTLNFWPCGGVAVCVVCATCSRSFVTWDLAGWIAQRSIP